MKPQDLHWSISSRALVCTDPAFTIMPGTFINLATLSAFNERIPVGRASSSRRTCISITSSLSALGLVSSSAILVVDFSNTSMYVLGSFFMAVQSDRSKFLRSPR